MFKWLFGKREKYLTPNDIIKNTYHFTFNNSTEEHKFKGNYAWFIDGELRRYINIYDIIGIESRYFRAELMDLPVFFSDNEIEKIILQKLPEEVLILRYKFFAYNTDLSVFKSKIIELSILAKANIDKKQELDSYNEYIKNEREKLQKELNKIPNIYHTYIINYLGY
jgi:hypothetical protein